MIPSGGPGDWAASNAQLAQGDWIMGTRANIVRKNEDESFDVIYTHWDGYPSHHAPILLDHYSDDAKVAELLALGDLSVLGEEIGKKHAFDSNVPESWCTAYGRDRGETDVSSRHLAGPAELKEYLDDSWTEWVYVWDVTTRSWYYTNNPSPTWFKCCGTEQRTIDRLEHWQRNEQSVTPIN